MRMVRVGGCRRFIMRIGVLNPSPVGIERRCRIIEQQRLAIPVKPEVTVLALFVNPVIEILYNGDRGTVKRPKREFWYFVALFLHLLHDAESDIPFIPISDGIGHIHDKYVHSGVDEHRHILADHIVVLTQEISHLRFSPVIGVGVP